MQQRFLTNGQVVNEKLITKVVGLRFNEASQTLKKGQRVSVKPITQKGYVNVLGVFNQHGQVGNILANKTIEEYEYEMRGGKVYTNTKLKGNLEALTFTVKKVNRYNAVLTASF